MQDPKKWAEQCTKIVEEDLSGKDAPPELISRLRSAIVSFAPLNDTALGQIIDRRLEDLERRRATRFDNSVRLFLLDYAQQDEVREKGARDVVGYIDKTLQIEIRRLKGPGQIIYKRSNGETCRVQEGSDIVQPYRRRRGAQSGV